MSFEFLSFWVRETISNIGRNRLMSVLAVTTVTVGLFILGTFFLTVSNLSAAVDGATHKLDLVVFLKSDITDKRRKEIYDAVRIPQVAKLDFVSKSQVLREMKKTMPDIPMEDFRKDNPLSDELRIKLKPGYINDIFKIQSYLNTIPGVIKARRDDEPVRKLLSINSFLAVAGVASLIVLGLAILLIIHNAIRLTIFARRREIRIMEMVGATAWFIRIPFLLEGTFYGLIGAIIAATGLFTLWMTLINTNLAFIKMLMPLTQSDLMIKCILLMLVTGIVFGLIGSWASLSRSIGKAAHV